jgi:hypothetical protein
MAKAKAKSKGKNGKQAKLSKGKKKKVLKNKVAAKGHKKSASKKKAAARKATPQVKVSRMESAPAMNTTEAMTEMTPSAREVSQEPTTAEFSEPTITSEGEFASADDGNNISSTM